MAWSSNRQEDIHQKMRNWRKGRCDMTPIVFMGSPALPCPYCWFVHYPADIHKYLPDEAFVLETEDGTLSSEDGENDPHFLGGGIRHLYRKIGSSVYEEQFSFESSYRVCGWNSAILNESDPSDNWTWSWQEDIHQKMRNWRRSRCPKIPIVFMGSPSLSCPYCWFVHYPDDIHKYLPDEVFVMKIEDGAPFSLLMEDCEDGICHLYRNGEEQFSFESTYRVCAWNCDILNETDPSGNWTWYHD